MEDDEWNRKITPDDVAYLEEAQGALRECLDDWISRFEDLGTLTLSLMLVRTSLEGLVRVEGSSSFRDLVNDLISLVMDELNSGEKE